ncbi:HxlR family transcriptional regulator [Actinocatenispora thailandica]|uniref:HxlR family transcriptional regulator n=1 Tax=Actinocatenispora thailandica TaxID=227318 RepID=A0A7R7DML9_9ACTN|nr:helix-turn-helix domain-containing protein [Actinocatenispora thailandica]BCJ34157.1 HxlR family transcriptional regulator [Actinocatenispora thailandica]
MDWREQSPENCSIALTLDLVGKPWVLLVLREVFRGLHRFDEIAEHIGISPAVLTRQLHMLVDGGVLERRPYREPGQRPRHEYWLTASGEELFPVLSALKSWGDRHLAGPTGPATIHRHHGCGSPVAVTLRCEAGHRLAGLDEIDVEPGPGAVPLRRSPRS